MKKEERIWREFWKPIVTKNGKINMGQVKRELADFYFAMQEVPKVYQHVTGGKLSKINYPADTVIDAADAHIQDEIDSYLGD